MGSQPEGPQCRVCSSAQHVRVAGFIVRAGFLQRQPFAPLLLLIIPLETAAVFKVPGGQLEAGTLLQSPAARSPGRTAGCADSAESATSRRTLAGSSEVCQPRKPPGDSPHTRSRGSHAQAVPGELSLPHWMGHKYYFHADKAFRVVAFFGGAAGSL